MPPFITLTGQSHKEYIFTVIPLNKKLPDAAGVYVVTTTFQEKNGEVHHTPLQVGSCHDLSKLNNRTRIQKMINDGTNCLCVKIEEITESRLQIEDDLNKNYFPQ